MDLMARRRMMMLFGGEPTPPEPSGGRLSDYVQSGLVLHMDGKTGKTGDTSWDSVVGNYSFTNHGATFGDNYVQFDGVDDYLVNTSFSPGASSTGTIEVCYDLDSISVGLVFAGKTNGGMAFGFNSSKLIIFSIGRNARTRSQATEKKASVSVSAARQYENGVQMATNSTDYWSGRDSNNYIGRRSSGSYLKGKVHSIRIYSRQLSAAEILQNLSVDNIRFNLGLNI